MYVGLLGAFPFIILWKYAKQEKASINQRAQNSEIAAEVNFIQEVFEKWLKINMKEEFFTNF